MKIAIGEEFDFPQDANNDFLYRCELYKKEEESESVEHLKRGAITKYTICEIKGDEILFDYSLGSTNHFIMNLEEFKSMFNDIEEQEEVYEIY